MEAGPSPPVEEKISEAKEDVQFLVFSAQALLQVLMLSAYVVTGLSV